MLGWSAALYNNKHQHLLYLAPIPMAAQGTFWRYQARSHQYRRQQAGDDAFRLKRPL